MAVSDQMDYITIATLGSGTDAGNLIDAVSNNSHASGDTRGASFGGITGDSADGYVGYQYATVDYIVFHTSNNAADFGDLSVPNSNTSVAASTTRWVMKSGQRYTSGTGAVGFLHMDWWTVASGGASADFGDIA